MDRRVLGVLSEGDSRDVDFGGLGDERGLKWKCEIAAEWIVLCGNFAVTEFEFFRVWRKFID